MSTDENIKMHVAQMEGMMESCYAYGGVEVGSYNFEKYIAHRKEILGEELFNKVYSEKLKELSEFEMVSGVFTDSEGGSYNSLVRKQNNQQ